MLARFDVIGIFDRSRHRRNRRLVQHVLDAVDGTVGDLEIRQIAGDQLRAAPAPLRDGCAEALAPLAAMSDGLAGHEVVDDPDTLAPPQELFYKVRADEARATGHEIARHRLRLHGLVETPAVNMWPTRRRDVKRHEGSRRAGQKRMLQPTCKPNSVPPSPRPFGLDAAAEMTIPLAPALLTGSSNLPGRLRRAAYPFDSPAPRGCARRLAKGRSPIWSCSVWGFACHACYQTRGALLPHLFTLTRLRPPRFAAPRLRAAGPQTMGLPRRSPKARRADRKAGGIFSVPLVRRVAPPGNYPAHCPVEFGLSSPARTSRCPKPAKTGSGNRGYPQQRSSGRLQQLIIARRVGLRPPAAASLRSAGGPCSLTLARKQPRRSPRLGKAEP